MRRRENGAEEGESEADGGQGEWIPGFGGERLGVRRSSSLLPPQPSPPPPLFLDSLKTLSSIYILYI